VLTDHNYCRVFILANPADKTEVFGFYTLSPSCFPRSNATGSEQKRIPGGIPVPMMLLGFMGRSDGAPKGLGAALVAEAARRVHQSTDLAAWGLTLEAEGGRDTRLWDWYKKIGFVPAKITPASPTPPGLMYAPLRRLFDQS
jgi:hypothetical protein